MLPSNSPVPDACGNANEMPPSNLAVDASESPCIPRVGSDESEESAPKVEEKEDSNNDTSPDVLGKHPTEVMFFRFLHAELRKSIHFFDRACEEYRIRATRLKEGTAILKRSGHALVDDKWLVIARAAFKVYRDLVLLETYAIMTYCGFSKILKKHDKMTGRTTRAAFMKSMVSKANFSDTAQLQEMIQMSLEKYREASMELEKAGRTNLQEDERLFINLIAQINEDVLVTDAEDTPVGCGQRKLSIDIRLPTKQESTSSQTTSIERCEPLIEKHDSVDESERKRPKLA